ncbi:MAG TPA: hypothetical protein VLH75_03285 [Longimicrobiales bacterium]|nr:hypothetical protein [Longimicrobiales bacterium]
MSPGPVVGHPDARAFLRRAEGWLMRREDERNLTLSVAGALGDPPPLGGGDGYLFATVEEEGEVVGCAFRTPPHKLCLTRLPVAGAAGVAEVMARRYGSLPGVRGPAEAAWAVGGGVGGGFRRGRGRRLPHLPRRPGRVGGAGRPLAVGGG